MQYLKKHNDLYVALKGILEASIACCEGRMPSLRRGTGICGNLGDYPLSGEESRYFSGVLCQKFSQTRVACYPVRPPRGCPEEAFHCSSPWEKWGNHPYAENRRRLLRDCIRYLEVIHGDTSFFTKAFYLLTVKFWRQ